VTWWTWADLRGAVLEEIAGEIVDIGAGGCSVETSSRLDTGTFGFVEIQSPDASLAEVARVCAVTERPGAAAPFLLRLEFLNIALPVHLAVGDGFAEPNDAPLVAAGEKAGRSLTLVRRGQRATGEASDAIAQNPPERHGNAEANDLGTSLADDLKK
jgi:hypothetical protein